MRQEDKFIIELLMPNTDWSSNEKLNNTLDWDYIIHHCIQHKLLPVLYNRIRNALQIPQYIVQILDNEYKIRKHIYSKQKDEFLHLLNELDKAVFRVMKSLGYVQGKYNRNTHTIDKFDNNRLNGYESELQHYGEFVKLSGSDFFPIYSVDVHHRLSTIFDSFYYDSNLLFQRAKKENIQGINFWRLSNEDFLLHLSS